MNRQDYILAVLSAGGVPAQFSPVQLQKLFFVLDRELHGMVGGPHFDFQPYDYGPFDKDVYQELDAMGALGLVMKIGGERHRQYLLSDQGFRRGQHALGQLSDDVQRYVSELSRWVRSLSFAQLVSAIYQAYPDMKVNSIFQ